MALSFEQGPDGWSASNGKFRVRREGLRVGQRFTLLVNGRCEASLFAWQEQRAGPDGPEFLWTLAASPQTGQIGIGAETFASIYEAFFSVYQTSTGFPPGKLHIAFDPGIERKACERWSP